MTTTLAPMRTRAPGKGACASGLLETNWRARSDTSKRAMRPDPPNASLVLVSCRLVPRTLGRLPSDMPGLAPWLAFLEPSSDDLHGRRQRPERPEQAMKNDDADRVCAKDKTLHAWFS